MNASHLSASHLDLVLPLNAGCHLSSYHSSHISFHFLILLVAVCTSEHARELEDIKHVVHLLHTALHLPEHHLLKERQLLEKLDNLKQELSPLEKVIDVTSLIKLLSHHTDK